MFGTSSFKSRSNSLDLLVRTAVLNSELAPGVAAQIQQYRTGKLTCEERRLLAVLDDAIAGGHVVPAGLSDARGYRYTAVGIG